MANIKQQRKRVKIAARERSENLRYKSRIKTMFKSLTVAAQEDKERASQLGLELISLIDKAASRGVIHANNAARKKSRVTSLVELAEGTGKTPGPATSEPKSGQSKSDKRAGRHAAKAAKTQAVKEKQAAKAEAEAKAAKARPKKEAKAEEAAGEAAEEAPAEEAPTGEAAEEAPAEEETPAAEEAPAEEETPAAEEAPAEEPAAEEAPAEEAADEEPAAEKE